MMRFLLILWGVWGVLRDDDDLQDVHGPWWQRMTIPVSERSPLSQALAQNGVPSHRPLAIRIPFVVLCLSLSFSFLQSLPLCLWCFSCIYLSIHFFFCQSLNWFCCLLFLAFIICQFPSLFSYILGSELVKGVMGLWSEIKCRRVSGIHLQNRNLSLAGAQLDMNGSQISPKHAIALPLL